jgi:hypothetical protein
MTRLFPILALALALFASCAAEAGDGKSNIYIESHAAFGVPGLECRIRHHRADQQINTTSPLVPCGALFALAFKGQAALDAGLLAVSPAFAAWYQDVPLQGRVALREGLDALTVTAQTAP